MNAGDLLFLDAGVLSLLTHPRGGEEPRRCRAWARSMLEAGVRLFVAEVTDYELRRELIRAKALAGLRRLDQLRTALDYAPITTAAVGVACHLWAESRQAGRQTAADASLDCDVLLAAQALQAAGVNRSVMIASANVKHLEQFLTVRPWERIFPANLVVPVVLSTPDHSSPLATTPVHMD